jgi:hypothetical protein
MACQVLRWTRLYLDLERVCAFELGALTEMFFTPTAVSSGSTDMHAKAKTLPDRATKSLREPSSFKAFGEPNTSP